MKSLGELLKDLRGNRSLREVAEITELSHTYISDVEKGYRRGSGKPIHPSPDTLKRLAQAYSYPYEELMKVAGYWDEDDVKAEKEFEAFANDPELGRWYRELPESDEEDLRKLRQMWDIIKSDKRK